MPTSVTQKAISHLYVAFANIPKPHVIDGCLCCIERKDVDTLLATPMKDISPERMALYESSAKLTVLPDQVLEIRASKWER